MPMMYSPICAYKYQIGSILNESGDRMGNPHNLMGCHCRCLVLFWEFFSVRSKNVERKKIDYSFVCSLSVRL